jgi:hypothetical protein
MERVWEQLLTAQNHLHSSVRKRCQSYNHKKLDSTNKMKGRKQILPYSLQIRDCPSWNLDFCCGSPYVWQAYLDSYDNKCV